MQDIDQQIDTMGFADVIVFLKPEVKEKGGNNAKLALSETRDLQSEVAHKLGRCFSSFANSKQSILAKEVRQLATGKMAAMAERMPAFPEVPAKAKAMRFYPNLGIMLGSVDKSGLSALTGNESEVATIGLAPQFGLIRPQEAMALSGQPSGTSWGISRMKADKLWDKGIEGEGIYVGQVDTGVDAKHPALKHAIDAFAEFDLMGEEVAGAAARDSGDHGTHTAGLIAGKEYKGLRFGVAPKAKLACAMVIEHGDFAARLLGGLNWCVGQGTRIINISLGRRGYHQQFIDIIRILRAREILPVVAIGNEGPNSSRSPGNFKDVLSVGAMDDEDNIWLDSSSMRMPGPPAYSKPDIIAPGVDMWSCLPGKKLGAYNGTSMAAPHIAGLAALLWSHKPDAPMAKIEKAIIKSCKRPASITSMRGNKGVPDAAAALKLL
jgi:subtilisin